MIRLKNILYCVILLMSVVDSKNLKELISKSIERQPEVQMALANYRASQYALEGAKSDFLPKVDVRAELGRENTEIDYSFSGTHRLTEHQVSVVGSYNLFDGYKTTHTVAEKKSAIQIAKNRVIEQINKSAMLMVKAYIELLRQKAILDIQELNYQNHLETLEKVRLRLQAGDGYESNYRQTKARVKLAEVNRLIAKRSYLNAEINYRKLFGEVSDIDSMEIPKVELFVQNSDMDKILTETQEQNIKLKIQEAKIGMAKSIYAEKSSSDYPRVDMELSQVWNRNVHGFKGEDKGSKIALVLNYNLYNGGADQLAKREALEKSLSQEESLNQTKLDIDEEMSLTLMKYNILKSQIELIQEQLHHLEGTKELYELEYQNSKRTIIDVLNIKQEYSYAKTQEINAKYDQLLAYYHFKEIKNELLGDLGIDSLIEDLE